MKSIETLVLPERVGIIAAHPDDIEGMLSSAALASKDAYALVATSGEASTLRYGNNYLC